MDHSNIGVIIVAYNTTSVTIKKLQNEVESQMKVPCFVVDNTQDNIGFARAVNKGILLAQKKKCTLFIICNPDIHNLRCSTKNIYEAAKHFDIFGGVMYQENTVYYGGVIDYWTMAGGLNLSKPKQRLSKCDFVSGAFMCIRDTAIKKIGLLPEDYFMYYEDVAYCYLARKNGLHVGITTAISYKHDELSRKFIQKNYYLSRNRLKFLFTFGTVRQKIRELLYLPLIMLSLYLHRSPTNSLQLQGYIDFLHGKKISD